MTSTFVAKLINVEFIRFECVMTNYNKERSTTGITLIHLFKTAFCLFSFWVEVFLVAAWAQLVAQKLL